MNEQQKPIIEVALQLERTGQPELVAAGRKLRDAVGSFLKYEREEDVLRGVFNETHADIEDLKAAGWYLDTNQGGHYWWRHRETRRVQAMPFWIVQLLYQFRDDGNEQRKKLRDDAMKSFQAAAQQVFGVKPPRLVRSLKKVREAMPDDAPLPVEKEPTK